MKTEFSFDQLKLSVSNVIGCTCDYAFLSNNNDDVGRFEDAVGNDVRRDVMTFLLEENIDLETVTVDVTFTTDLESVSQATDCIWIIYQTNETSLHQRLRDCHFIW